VEFLVHDDSQELEARLLESNEEHEREQLERQQLEERLIVRIVNGEEKGH